MPSWRSRRLCGKNARGRRPGYSSPKGPTHWARSRTFSMGFLLNLKANPLPNLFYEGVRRKSKPGTFSGIYGSFA